MEEFSCTLEIRRTLEERYQLKRKISNLEVCLYVCKFFLFLRTEIQTIECKILMISVIVIIGIVIIMFFIVITISQYYSS